MGGRLAAPHGQDLLEGQREVGAAARLAVADVVRGEDQPLGIDGAVGVRVGSGSWAKASSAAPAIQRSLSARATASSSTSSPRAVLIRIAVGFIARSAFSPMSVRVSSVSDGVQRDDVALGQQRRQVHQRDARGGGALGGDVGIGGEQAHVPARQAAGHVDADAAEAHDADRLAEQELAAVLALRPLAAAQPASPRLMRLSSISSRPMVASATAMKFSGVGLLATSTPSREAGRDVDLVHADEGHDDQAEVRRRASITAA